MDKIKIAFFDIDGTILEFEHKEITDKMRETLNQLQKNGIIICIATGRAPLTLPHFDGVDFDAYLTFNGSYCYNRKEAIFDNPIPKEDVHKLIANATDMGRPVSIATKKRLVAMENGSDELKAVADDVCGDVAEDGIYYYCKKHKLI